MSKKLQKFIFSFLAIGLILQISGVGTLFAEELKKENETVIEEVEKEQDDVLDDEIIADTDTETDEDDGSDVEEEIKSDLALGDFKLTFKDYNGAYTSNAYIKTGTATTGIITYNLAGQEGVAANTLAFRLKFPKGSDVKMADNTSYTLSFGSETSPTGTPLPSDQYTYVWFTLRTPLNSAQTETINFDHTPKLVPGQIGTDDVVIEIAMDAFELKTEGISKLPNETKSSMISYADLFAFNNVSSSFNYFNQNVTTKTDGALSTITFNQSVSHRYSASTAGLVHTSKIIYTNTFEVEKNSSNNPYIKFTRNDIVKPNGGAFANTELNVQTNSEGYVTSFTIITEAIASANQQLSNSSAGFKINTPQLDKELMQNDFNLAIGQSKKVYITNTASSARAIPVSTVSGLAGNVLDLTVSTVGTTGATYTNASETGDESYSQKVSKRLFTLANISTVGSNMDRLAAYKNDIAIFDIGYGWANKQENNIDRLEFVEYADHDEFGYKSDELRPLRIQTGTVSVRNKKLVDATVGLSVIVEYNDGTPNFTTTLTASDLAESQTLKIPTDNQEKVKTIRFVYTNVDPGFSITSAPKIEYRVVGGDTTKQGLKISNTAQLNYSYNGKDFTKKSEEPFFRYRDVEVDKDGLYKSNKNGENLSRTTIQEKDDVVLFSIEIENRKNDEVAIKTIFDEYTYNLSPYDGLHKTNNDPDADLIDSKYIARDENGDLLNPTNVTNLVLWRYVSDPSNPDAEPVLTRLEDQSAIENITFVPSTETEYSTMTITFADDALVLEQGEKVVLTYTMYTNDRFEKDATIGNRFEALQEDASLIGKGEYWRSKPNDTETDPIQSSSYNKSGVNASGTTLGEKPFVGDIVIYTLTFNNQFGEDWNNIKIVDTYSTNLSPYSSKNGISDELFNQYGLVENQPLNIGVMKDGEGNYIMPAGFDIDKVSVTVSSDGRSFEIDLGDNVLLEDEKLQLSYTMTLNDTADAKESIVNRFVLSSNDEEVSRGHHYWSAHDNATQGGIISNIKSVQGIEKDGRIPDINRLVDGEQLEYTVTLSNYLPRPNRVVHVKNVIDYMPKYITYVEDSFTLEHKSSVLQPDGESYEEVTTDIDPSTYTMEYNTTTNQIEVRFNSNYEQAGGVEGSNLNKPTNSVIMKYKGLVDSTNEDMFDPINPGLSREEVTNSAVAFYEEDISTLVAKSGTLVKKTDTAQYQDGDDETHTYIASSSKVQVLNENNPFGWISKSVSNNSSIDVLSEDEVTREYSITAYNTAFKNFDVTHIVDLLPQYETVNTDKGVKIVDNQDGEEYEAVYNLDTVTINGYTYNRVIVTGYIKDGVEEVMTLPAITLPGQNRSMTLSFETDIDKEQAKKDLYLSDTYTKTLRNNVAMYTDEEITLFTPQGVNVSSASKKTDDHIEETDWDSDINTSIRYETSVAANIYASAITPYMDIRAQIVEVSGASGVTYRNASDTDYINPGDIVGWKVRVGNSNVANTPAIKAGTSIIMELPDGLVFDGYSVDDTPTFLEEVQVSEDDSILIWKTTVDIPQGSQLQFIFRTTTRSAFYEVYTIDGYFVPHDVSPYGFFNSKVYASNEYRSYNSSDRRRNYLFEPNYGELPTEYGLGDTNYHYVTGTENANVLGNLSIGGRLEVQSQVQTNKKATTNAAPYFIHLNDVEDPVTFSMYLDVYKVGAGVKDVQFINRLAGENDRFVLRNQERRSQGSQVLIDDGNFVAQKVNATTGSIIETLDESVYTVQYAVVDYNYNFTDNDWDLVNTDIWMDADELIAAGYEFTDVTATRTIIDNAVALDMNEAIKVSYSAKLEDYHNPTWQAYNSYAYGAVVDGSTFVQAETRSLGLKSNIYADRLKLVTEVIDPALTPLRVDFELEVVAYDKDTDDEVGRMNQLVTVDDVAGVLENISWIEDLSRSNYFKVIAKEYEGFRTPVVELDSETDQYGLTTWNAHITYERIVYDEIEVEVEVNTINDKYPINDVTYRLHEFDVNGDLVDSEDRLVSLTARSIFDGKDTILDRETGHTFEIEALDIPQYTYKLEELDQEDLDTTGIKHTYKLTYTQEKEVIDDKDDKDDKDGKGSKKDPSTGIQDKTFIYLGVLAVAIGGVILIARKTKKKENE